jgi:peptidyl-prolyl cis-trans isomerase D
MIFFRPAGLRFSLNQVAARKDDAAMWRMKDKTLSTLEAEKLKKNFWTYAVLLTSLGAMAFFGVCNPSRSGGGGGALSGSAASVGDEVISRTEFARAYDNARQRYQQQFGEQFDPGAMKLAHTVMQELVDERSLYLKAVELGMRASDEEVYDALRREKAFQDESGKFSSEVFENVLRANGFTEASLFERIRRDLTTMKLRRFVTDTAFVSTKAAELDYRISETKLDVEYLKFDPAKTEVKVDPAEVDKMLADEAGKKKIKEYFDANTAEFNTPEQVKARHILVSFKGARNATPEAAKREKDAAKKMAEEIAAKAKEPGTDFAALAKEKTDEPAGKTSGGDLGWFDRTKMVKEFADAAFAMKPGDVSGVVESPFGFHVIKLEEHKDAVSTKLEDAQKKIAETILLKEKRPAITKEHADKVLAELKAGKPATELLAADKVEWQATGDVGASSRFLPGIGSSQEVSDALASFKTVGQLYPTALDVRGSYYILRLKGRKDADMTKLDDEKKKELATTAAFSEGYALFSAYEKQLKDQLEKKQKVWQNPDYLALDEQRAPADQGG